MNSPITQAERAQRLLDLHHSDKLLILPNIWDTIGALLLERLGYPAVATASAAIALSNGYNDAENIPLANVLSIAEQIVRSVNVPVTVDFESGFAATTDELKKNIKRLLNIGISGINFEDTNKRTGKLYSIDEQCERLRAIKAACVETGMSLVVNARTDVFVRGEEIQTSEQKVEETIRRGLAYKDSGADCFFPLAAPDAMSIQSIVTKLNMPVNIILIPGVPGLLELERMGVRRVSLGPGFLKIAIRAMRDVAARLKDYRGVEEVTGNDVTSEFLAGLVNESETH